MGFVGAIPTLRTLDMKKPKIEFMFAVVTTDKNGQTIYTFYDKEKAEEFADELEKILISKG